MRDPCDVFVSKVVPGRSVADVGGLWGTHLAAILVLVASAGAVSAQTPLPGQPPDEQRPPTWQITSTLSE